MWSVIAGTGTMKGMSPILPSPSCTNASRHGHPCEPFTVTSFYRKTWWTSPVSEALEKEIQDKLEKAFTDVHGTDCLFPESRYFEEWEGVQSAYAFEGVETGLPRNTLVDTAGKLNRVPAGFSVNSKLQRLMEKRLSAVASGKDIDWANAETLGLCRPAHGGVSHQAERSGCGSGNLQPAAQCFVRQQKR